MADALGFLPDFRVGGLRRAGHRRQIIRDGYRQLRAIDVQAFMR